MAERAQYAAYRSLDPAGDGSLLLAAKLAQVAHMAYDVPKKYDATTILSMGAELLSNAGLSCSSDRSTSQIAETMQLEFDNPIALLPSPANFPGRQAVAGMVWVPWKKTKLSAMAGGALRRRLLKNMFFDGLASDAERVPLDAVGGVLAHRLVSEVGPLLKHVKAQDPDPLIPCRILLRASR